MDQKTEMRLTGSGGQGVILASVILAEAAVIDGMNAAQTQAYGPEARGGVCKAEAIVSNEEIQFTRVRKPDLLLALNQASLDKFSVGLPETCVIVADSELETPAWVDPDHIVKLGILKTALEKTGRVMTANIVAVGAINSLFGLFHDEAVREAVMKNVPKGSEEMNEKALSAGMELGRKARSEKKRKPSSGKDPAGSK